MDRLIKRVRDGDYDVDRVAAADAMLRRSLWITAWDVAGPRLGDRRQSRPTLVALPSAPPTLEQQAA